VRQPPEQYGDVELRVQASRCHSSVPRDGCGHTSLELYDQMEVALRWRDAKRGQKLIRQPSGALGIQGFDHLWAEDLAVAEYVPRERVDALRQALRERAEGLSDREPRRRAVDAEADRGLPLDELDVDLDVVPERGGVERAQGSVACP
jgi:hypothetical protein